MTDISMLIFILCLFGLGIAVGMLLYRTLWHLDTASLREEIEVLKGFNRALQDEIYHLRMKHDELLGRLALVEETNREIVRGARR